MIYQVATVGLLVGLLVLFRPAGRPKTHRNWHETGDRVRDGLVETGMVLGAIVFLFLAGSVTFAVVLLSGELGTAIRDLVLL